MTVGISMKRYIADRRIYRAALDIRDTKERLIDIAIKYGFSSQEALTRALKSSYGYTPNTLRRNPNLFQLPVRRAGSHLDIIKEKREYSMNDYLEKGKQILDDYIKTTTISQMLKIIVIS